MKQKGLKDGWQKKKDLINKMNPEWKDLVTEYGFVKEKITFTQQVDDLIKELQESGMISPIS
ncbi:MAG: hypothetical protein IPH57_08405 [Saprospiraceae bacterium]|nr:hypothetical protein [Saprospiraceae bacterium]